MTKPTTLLIFVCGLIVTGCLSELHTSPAAVSTSSSGTIGFEHSHIFFRTVEGQLDLLVWKAFSSTDVWDQTSGPDSETMTLEDDRTLQWERKTDSEIITVNQKNYSLEDGKLLLLGWKGDQVQVQQLKLDLSTLGSSSDEIRKSLMKLAKEDQTVREFLEAIEMGKSSSLNQP